VNPMSFGTPMIEAEASVCNITISFGTWVLFSSILTTTLVSL
jgi:hypothetical protein